jgi:hypothetical protein
VDTGPDPLLLRKSGSGLKERSAASVPQFGQHALATAKHYGRYFT